MHSAAPPTAPSHKEHQMKPHSPIPHTPKSGKCYT